MPRRRHPGRVFQSERKWAVYWWYSFSNPHTLCVLVVCTLEVVRLDTTAQCERSFHRCSRMSCRRVTQSWKSRECAYWHADCCDGAWRKLQDYTGKASDRGSSQPSRSSPSVPHAHTHEHARALVWETAFSHFLPTYLLPPSPLGFCRRLSLAPADPSFSRPRLAEF